MKVSQMLLLAHSHDDKVHTTNIQANIQSVAQTLTDKKIGALPVLQNGVLVGIISERDITIEVVAKGLDPKKTIVKDIMVPNPVTVSSSNDLNYCLDTMKLGKFRHLPVVDNNKLVGMISVRDVLITLLKENSDLANHLENYIISNR